METVSRERLTMRSDGFSTLWFRCSLSVGISILLAIEWLHFTDVFASQCSTQEYQPQLVTLTLLWHSPKHVVSTVDYTVQQHFSWRNGLLLVLFGGRDWKIIAPMCFVFDIRSPLTNPTKYLVMMDSREIWRVTTAYIFCCFPRLFTLMMTVLWMTESLRYQKVRGLISSQNENCLQD